MGCFSSQPSTSAEGDENNPPFDNVSIRFGKLSNIQVKMVILGGGDTGKSVICQHFEKIYNKEFPKESYDYISRIMKLDIIKDMKIFVKYLIKSGNAYPPEYCEAFEEISYMDLNPDELTNNILNYIKEIWGDSNIKENYSAVKYLLGLNENTDYLLDRLDFITSSDYVPFDNDFFKFNPKSTDLMSYKFEINDLKVELIDIGGKGKDKGLFKESFKGVDYLIYVISLTSFYKKLYGSEEDQIQQFKDMAESILFNNKGVFLVLNKLDLFCEMVEHNPEKFKIVFPDFNGDIKNWNECIEYIRQRLIDSVLPRSSNASIHVLFTSAVDADSVNKMFQEIGKNIIENYKPKESDSFEELITNISKNINLKNDSKNESSDDYISSVSEKSVNYTKAEEDESRNINSFEGTSSNSNFSDKITSSNINFSEKVTSSCDSFEKSISTNSAFDNYSSSIDNNINNIIDKTYL